MTTGRVYRRLVADSIPRDAVVVSIGGETEDEMTISVMYPAKGGVPADEEAQADVAGAFTYADELSQRRRFQRVLVAIENPAIWRLEWGTLSA